MNRSQWNALIQHYQGSFLQSWEWGTFQESYGRPVYRIQFPHGATQLILHRLPFARNYVLSPDGPVGDMTYANTQECVDIVNTLSRFHHILFWRYQHWGDRIGGMTGLHPNPLHRWVLDVQSTRQMLTHMHPKCRYNIHLAHRNKVTVHVTTDEHDIEKMYTLLHTSARRHGFSLHPKRYYDMMIRCLAGSGMLRMYFAEYHGKMIASTIVIGFGHTMTIFSGGTEYAYRYVMAPHLLHWQILQDAYQERYTQVDFGVVSDVDDAEHPLAGLTQFKKRFGGRLMLSEPVYDMPLSQNGYALYRSAHQLYAHIRKGHWILHPASPLASGHHRPV